MVYLFRKILAALLSFALTMTGFAAKPQKPMAEFYVSVYGSDSNTGTEDSPFASLQKARDAVRKISGNMTGDIVVHIAAGTYVLQGIGSRRDMHDDVAGHVAVDFSDLVAGLLE